MYGRRPHQVISRLYQSDDAALRALRQNSQILLPIYSSPTLMQDSYDGLLAAMGQRAVLTWGKQPQARGRCRPQRVGWPDRVHKIAGHS